MQNRAKYFHGAQIILEILSEQNIELVSEAHSNQQQLLINAKRRNIRFIADKLIDPNIPGPGLTMAVATTLLKVGACEEMAQRFCFEYFKRYHTQEISLIMLDHEKLEGATNNHVFVLIGAINVDSSLLIGRGNEAARISSSTPHVELVSFLNSQPPDCIVVDPFLNFCAPADENCELLQQYCNARNITHVVGVKKYHDTPGLLTSITAVEENAKQLAKEINKQLGLLLLNNMTPLLLPAISSPKWTFSTARNCFVITDTEEKLRELMACFGQHGFSTGRGQEVGLARSPITNVFVLEMRHVDTLDIKRFLAIGGTLIDSRSHIRPGHG